MTVAPIRKAVTVRADPERAFRVFTRGLDTWWPLETHSRAADAEEEGLEAERVELEERAGGRILEHLSNGEVLPWGEILVWEPPSRLVVAWKPNATANPPTEVDVRFTATAEGTLVELEHRAWERLGDLAVEKRAGYDTGWDPVMARYEAAANEDAA